MRRLACVALAACLLCVALLGTASATPTKASTGKAAASETRACPSKNRGEAQITRRALLIDRRGDKAVIYTKTKGRDYRMYGCVKKSRKRTLLASWYSCECSISDEYGPTIDALAGRYVALNFVSSGSPQTSGDNTGSVSVVDLTSGASRPIYDTGGGTDQVILKPNGSVAFTFDSDRSTYPSFEGKLVRIDRTGTSVLAETGVEGGSLAMAPTGRHIYWTEQQAQYRGARID